MKIKARRAIGASRITSPFRDTVLICDGWNEAWDRTRDISKFATPEKIAFADELRANRSKPEVALAKVLCSKRFGVEIREQVVLLGFITDFWCQDAGIAIEVDGPHHDSQIPYDLKRHQIFRDFGAAVIHIPSEFCPDDPDDACLMVATMYIAKSIDHRLNSSGIKVPGFDWMSVGHRPLF